MSAAEKLKALQTTDSWPDPDFSASQGNEVWAQIVAVVEAAEELPLIRVGDATFSATALRAALAALDEALS